MNVYYIKAKDGKEYPIRFSQSVAFQLAAEESVPMNKVAAFFADFQSWPIGRVYRYYILAFRAGARKAGGTFDMESADFVDWLDEDDTILEQIIKYMIASFPADEGKKKAVKA